MTDLRPLHRAHVQDVEVVEALFVEATPEQDDGVAADEGGVRGARRGHILHGWPLPTIRRRVVTE